MYYFRGRSETHGNAWRAGFSGTPARMFGPGMVATLYQDLPPLLGSFRPARDLQCPRGLHVSLAFGGHQSVCRSGRQVRKSHNAHDLRPESQRRLRYSRSSMRIGTLFADNARRSEDSAVLTRSRLLIKRVRSNKPSTNCRPSTEGSRAWRSSAVSSTSAMRHSFARLAARRFLPGHRSALTLSRSDRDRRDKWRGVLTSVSPFGDLPAWSRPREEPRSPPAVDRLRSDIERAHAEAAAVIEGRLDPEEAAYDAPFSSSHGRVGLRPEDRATKRHNGNILAMDSPRALFDWLEVIRSCGIEDCVAEVLGERPVLSVEKTSLRRTPPDAEKGFHQDGAFLGDLRSVNIWLALSECGIDSPSLDFVGTPVNSIWPKGGEDAPFYWRSPKTPSIACAGIRLSFGHNSNPATLFSSTICVFT